MSKVSHSYSSPGDFATTRWSIVVAAGDVENCKSRLALSQLCETYWLPLYAYALRRLRLAEEARDMTQAFFAELLEKNYVSSADYERGRFRAFLIAAFKHFLSKQKHHFSARKRGGGIAILSLNFESADVSLRVEPVSNLTADQLFDQQWAIALLGNVMSRLEAEFVQSDHKNTFDVLKVFIAGSNPEMTYAMAAASLGTTEIAAKKAASRMRQRYRKLLREEIIQTLERPEDVEDEIRSLFAVLSL